MPETLKKIFLFRWNKKPLVFCFLLIIFLGLETPITAHAIPLLSGMADGIGKAFGWIIAAFLLRLPMAFAGIAALVLQWTIDPVFIRIPFTSGAVVNIGWPIVRDIANMGIVLALVIIGLATALRLEEYQARRTLPRLIFIALLINFTPVILGFIVDFCNIIMHFFLDGLMGIEYTFRNLSMVNDMISSDLGGFNFFNPVQLISFLFKIMIMELFYTLIGIIFLLFAVLFIMRRIAIWILVILSPIAFVAWILPAYRPFWTNWWRQFIQWSIIGIFAAFFLYLGDHIVGLAASGDFVGKSPSGFGGGLTAPIATILESVMPFVVATIFLCFGFFMSLNTSAIGAAGVISIAKGAATSKIAQSTLGRLDSLRTRGKEMVQKSEKTQQLSAKLATAKAPLGLTDKERALPWYKKAYNPKVLGKLGVGAVTAIPYETGRAIGRAGLGVGSSLLADLAKKEKEMEKYKTPDETFAVYQNATSRGSKIDRHAAWKRALEEGHLKAWEKKYGFSEDDQRGIAREALEIHPEAFHAFRTANPVIAAEVAEKFSLGTQEAARMTLDEDDKKKYKNIVEKIVAEMKPGDVEKMAPSSLKNEDIQNAIHGFWGGSQISAAGRSFGLSFIDTFNEGMKKRGTQWYKDNNTKIPRYLGSTPARELGFLDENDIGPGTGSVPPPGPSPGSSSPPPSPPPPSPSPRGRGGLDIERLERERRNIDTNKGISLDVKRRTRGRPGLGV